jgi:hypothetical protein
MFGTFSNPIKNSTQMTQIQLIFADFSKISLRKSTKIVGVNQMLNNFNAKAQRNKDAKFLLFSSAP